MSAINQTHDIILKRIVFQTKHKLTPTNIKYSNSIDT